MEFDGLPDLVLIKLLKLLRKNVSDINNLKYVNRRLYKLVTNYYDVLYYNHLNIDNQTINREIKNSRPILSLCMTCHAESMNIPKTQINHESVDPTNTFPMELTYHPNSPTAYLEHNIPKLNLSLLTHLTVKCQDRHALNRYLDLRDVLFRYINPEMLKEVTFDFCFLGRGPTHDDFLRAFSTHIIYPALRKLTIIFFDNGKLNWGDYQVVTLKRYIYGMALTPFLETITLTCLDNEMFASIHSMLDRISKLAPISKAEIERENMAVPSLGFYPLSRKVSFSFERGESTSNWVINLGPQVP